MHVPDMWEFLSGMYVSKEIDFKRHVPQKCMIRFEEIKGTVERHVQSDVPQEDAILLKEPGIYCFFLRCKMPRAEPFMEWVVETVLPREAQKLTSAIEEKDTTITLLTDDSWALEFTNEKHQQKILRLNK